MLDCFFMACKYFSSNSSIISILSVDPPTNKKKRKLVMLWGLKKFELQSVDLQCTDIDRKQLLDALIDKLTPELLQFSGEGLISLCHVLVNNTTMKFTLLYCGLVGLAPFGRSGFNLNKTKCPEDKDHIIFECIQTVCWRNGNERQKEQTSNEMPNVGAHSKEVIDGNVSEVKRLPFVPVSEKRTGRFLSHRMWPLQVKWEPTKYRTRNFSDFSV